ncbi:MAG: anaerobic ribonucleoside-triphosphate reductase activating protein [Oscillospiraceae bacterium]|nr:anaerobic ribonucleoside-triphosphate reductase activating protein [Oscillospiraceae bacterium]
MQLQLSGTANDSIVDGPGLRFTIFVQGCPHRCKGCHNPQTHDFKGGTPADTEELLEKIRRNPLLDGVTFSGGEPFCQALPLAEIGKKVHELGLNIITYTGYTFEELYERRSEEGIGELLAVTDFLIDGPFIEAQKSYQLQFRGSANQRILNCRKSLETGCAVETEFL